ncbi:MAG TPA: hypothetical protein VK666_23160 [Chryseolinea sp.]|nr:hypothetical protein [Chryseolinea sp.]
MILQVAMLILMITGFQEPASGIYIVHTPPKKVPCDHEGRMIIGKAKICIAKKPIINKEGITYASEIKYDPVFKLHYIEIGLSTSASQVLKKTVASLPESKFALAFEGEIVCTFSIAQEANVRAFRIGEDVLFSDLTIIHEALSKVKFNEN